MFLARMRASARLLASVFVALGLLSAPAAAEEDTAADTAAGLLFTRPHLAGIAPPAALDYRYETTTSAPSVHGEPFEDKITLEIAPPDSEHELNEVLYRVFRGERARTVGPFADVRGNPLTIIFLELDSFDMKRRFGGAPGMFRNMIRSAFRRDATIEEVEIEFRGRTLPARRVTITPFAHDRLPPELLPVAQKRYSFTVAPDVPGGLYEVESVLPDPEGGAALARKTATFMEKRDG